MVVVVVGWLVVSTQIPFYGNWRPKAWLNMTQLTALNARPGEVSPDGSGTKEPEVALKCLGEKVVETC